WRVIFEAHLARLLDEELALGLVAVGPDLDEVSDQRLERRQIIADLGGLRLLLVVEGRKQTERQIAMRIGNERGGRRLHGACRGRPPRAGRRTVAALRCGLRNWNALRRDRLGDRRRRDDANR